MFMPHEMTQGRRDVVVVLGTPTPKRILFATAELSPVCRVGGLADASAGLVAALRRAGIHVDVVVPDFDGTPGMEMRRADALHLPDWASPGVARHGHIDGLGPVIAVRVPGIERPHPYNDPSTGLGWDDNDRRFLRFSAAGGALAERLRPDVVHLNDWHTAAAAA